VQGQQTQLPDEVAVGIACVAGTPAALTSYSAMARSTSSRTRSTPSPGRRSGPARGRRDFLPVLTQPSPGPKRIELASANYGGRSWTLTISPPTSAGPICTTGSIPRSAG
jgi:hypothetical protein